MERMNSQFVSLGWWRAAIVTRLQIQQFEQTTRKELRGRSLEQLVALEDTWTQVVRMAALQDEPHLCTAAAVISDKLLVLKQVLQEMRNPVEIKRNSTDDDQGNAGKAPANKATNRRRHSLKRTLQQKKRRSHRMVLGNKRMLKRTHRLLLGKKTKRGKMTSGQLTILKKTKKPNMQLSVLERKMTQRQLSILNKKLAQTQPGVQHTSSIDVL